MSDAGGANGSVGGEQGLQAATDKMRADGIGADAVAVFADYYAQLKQGASGLIAESEIEPLGHLDALDDLDIDDDSCRSAADTVAVIKLNGGLGTSMGMSAAKSLLRVKGDATFLDVIINQVLHARGQLGARLPLIFMNSFRTRSDVEQVLARYPELAVDDLPVDFLQNREPKLLADSLQPAEWPKDSALEWCPPGHGDLWPALRATGLLELLIAAGFRYAFCSNSDNLGATFDPRIPAWMAAQEIPFAMESARRTPADRKGGHLAVRRADGRLVLRETAQTSPEDMAALGDLDRHRFCNTNNLWVELAALREALDRTDGVLGLPLIRNTKTLDPSDPSSPQVIQIESAMGAAVQCFVGARPLLVPRSRFVPVKTTNDLLVLRSDVYTLGADSVLALASGREVGHDPFVDLDSQHYKLIADFERHFPDGPVSLAECERFVVHGDVTFEGEVAVHGSVTLDADEPKTVPAGTVLS